MVAYFNLTIQFCIPIYHLNAFETIRNQNNLKTDGIKDLWLGNGEI